MQSTPTWIKTPRKLTDFGVEVEKKLAEFRASKNDLAAELGIGNSFLTAIISGDRKGEQYKKRICELLDIDQTRY